MLLHMELINEADFHARNIQMTSAGTTFEIVIKEKSLSN